MPRLAASDLQRGEMHKASDRNRTVRDARSSKICNGSDKSSIAHAARTDFIAARLLLDHPVGFCALFA
jgi:hypothetical protein